MERTTLSVHRKSHEEKYNELDTEEYEEYTVETNTCNEHEKVWTFNPMMDDDPIEGSSVLNTSTEVSLAQRDTVGYNRYRHICNVVN